MESTNKSELYELAIEMLENDQSLSSIERELIAKGASSEQVSNLLPLIKKARHKRKVKSGNIKLAFGSVILVSSFLFSLVNFHLGNSFAFVMYTFTTVGIVLLFWGLYDFFN
ncbi:MAG: hypothetical protein IPP56_01650 [Bacteroidetes bacterium]|nr:hypothetical protein [Bacteroidota bacterium]